MSNCAQIFLSGRATAPLKSKRGYPAGNFEYILKWFDAGADLSKRIELCRCPEGIGRANGLATALKEGDRNSGVPKALYVIGVEGEDVCKVGVSSTPIQRFQSLQEATYKDLRLHGVIYMAGKPMAEKVEQETLARGADLCAWQKREWLAMNADAAFALAFRTADDLKLKTCDSWTWVENMGARMKGVAREMARFGVR